MEYLPTNWDDFNLLSWGQCRCQYSSTMDPLGMAAAQNVRLQSIARDHMRSIPHDPYP